MSTDRAPALGGGNKNSNQPEDRAASLINGVSSVVINDFRKIGEKHRCGSKEMRSIGGGRAILS